MDMVPQAVGQNRKSIGMQEVMLVLALCSCLSCLVSSEANTMDGKEHLAYPKVPTSPMMQLEMLSKQEGNGGRMKGKSVESVETQEGRQVSEHPPLTFPSCDESSIGLCSPHPTPPVALADSSTLPSNPFPSTHTSSSPFSDPLQATSQAWDTHADDDDETLETPLLAIPPSNNSSPASLACQAADLQMRQLNPGWLQNYIWFEETRLEECLVQWTGEILPPGKDQFPIFTCLVPDSWKDSCKDAGGFVCSITIEAQFPTHIQMNRATLEANQGDTKMNPKRGTSPYSQDAQSSAFQTETPPQLRDQSINIDVNNRLRDFPTKVRKMVVPQCVSTDQACTSSPADAEALYARRVEQIDDWCRHESLESEVCSHVEATNNCWIISQLPKSAKIIGGVIGALLVLALMLGSVFWIRRCRANHHEEVLKRQLLRSAMRRSYKKSVNGHKTPISEDHPLLAHTDDHSGSPSPNYSPNGSTINITNDQPADPPIMI